MNICNGIKFCINYLYTILTILNVVIDIRLFEKSKEIVNKTSEENKILGIFKFAITI